MDLWTLGCELRARHGYAVVLRRSLGPKQPKAYLRSLRHSFLVVHSGSSGGSSEQGACGAKGPLPRGRCDLLLIGLLRQLWGVILGARVVQTSAWAVLLSG